MKRKIPLSEQQTAFFHHRLIPALQAFEREAHDLQLHLVARALNDATNAAGWRFAYELAARKGGGGDA